MVKCLCLLLQAAIQAVLNPHRQGQRSSGRCCRDMSVCSPIGHRSVKAQVCELVGVVRRSLVHIAAIFCHSEGGKWLHIHVHVHVSGGHIFMHARTHTHTHTYTVAYSQLLKMLNEFTTPDQKGQGRSKVKGYLGSTLSR